MTRVLVFLLVILAAAAGLHWLADRPGNVVVEWQGYIIETSVFRAIVILALLAGAAVVAWTLLRQVWMGPALLGRHFQHRRRKRGLDALSSGIIAIGAGDHATATRYAAQARKALPNEPLTHLLRAQAAQITGDRATARRIFEAMLASPDTEQLGLRGLFLEAEREGEKEVARQFAERALKLNPKLGWPIEATFDLQCRAEDWAGALETLAVARRHNLIDKTMANRRRAVLLAGRAQDAEDTRAAAALDLALEAHQLAPDLVPAAAIAGRILASRGNTPKAARVLLKTWRLAPHPDLAAAYAYARPGDSPRDRLNRIRHLSRLTPNDSEGPIALAVTAIEAREWDEARRALEPLLDGHLTQRVCTLMARIEGEQHGDAGRVREWLARAVNAPRDPAWTADGIASDHWRPTSPAMGMLDAYRWRVPVEAIDEPTGALLAAKVETLVGLGAATASTLEAPAQRKQAAYALEEVETPQLAASDASQNAAQAPQVTAPLRRATVKDAGNPPAPDPVARSGAAPPPDGVQSEDARRATTRTIVTRSSEREQPPVGKSLPPSGNTSTGRSRRKVAEPKIFVPPRAPDDPGPDDADTDALRTVPVFPRTVAKA